MNKKNDQQEKLVTMTLEEAIERHNRGEGKTDWERLENMTDEEIDEAVRNDPDAPPIVDKEFWEKGDKIDPAKKTPIHIYVDNEIAAFLREHPDGYHTRLNAVLRKYVEAEKKNLKQSA